ncbi:MAG TPA: hypothetical protein VK364_06055 [Hymenobacter sp.]|nr:hypothetical protein [Hymenobacter sp.]
MKEAFESDTIFYWQNVGLEQFTLTAQEKGYNLTEEFEWDSLEDLQKYIEKEGVTHASNKEEDKWEFVACYHYLGEVINKHFDLDWDLCKDGTAHNGMYIISITGDSNTYLVPRDIIISVILGRMEEGLKVYVEEYVKDEDIDFTWLDGMEEKDQ